MAKIYGYARVSTQQQNIERQVRNILSENKDAVIVRETYTGKTLSRPSFIKKHILQVQARDSRRIGVKAWPSKRADINI